VIEPAPSTDLAPGADTSAVTAGEWVIQLGSFAKRKNAESLQAKLSKAGFEAFVAPLETRGKRTFRVRVGAPSDRPSAERLHARLTRELGYSGMVVKGD
jgi:DedD protein